MAVRWLEGAELWESWIESEPRHLGIGTPLNSSLADTLRYDVAHEEWPEWIDRWAEEIIARTALAQAIELSLADLELAGPTGAETWVVLDGDFWLVNVRHGDLETGFGAVVTEARAELIAQVADGLQEAYIDHHWRAFPRCPLHEHPLRAAVIDGQACWYCPGDSDWQRPIGSLGSDEQYRAALARPS